MMRGCGQAARLQTHGVGREQFQKGSLGRHSPGPGSCGRGLRTCGVGPASQRDRAYHGIGQPSARGGSLSFTVVMVTSCPAPGNQGPHRGHTGVVWLAVVLPLDWAPFPHGPASERLLPPILGLQASGTEALSTPAAPSSPQLWLRSPGGTWASAAMTI